MAVTAYRPLVVNRMATPEIGSQQLAII